jgi:hypothetical protein
MRSLLEDELKRLERTGSCTKAMQVQRFFLEHRARKFSFGQELTLRINNKVVVPTYESSFMKTASTVRAELKMQHAVYFRILRKYFPEIAGLPTGNFSLGIRYPRPVLETTRFVGKRADLSVVNNFMKSHGKAAVDRYRGALFQDRNGRDPAVLDFFSQFFAKENGILNNQFYREYLNRVRDYQSRAFNLDEFYRAIELSHIFQYSF